MEFTDLKELRKLMAGNSDTFQFEEEVDTTTYDNRGAVFPSTY